MWNGRRVNLTSTQVAGTYLWSLVVPDGSGATLTGPTTQTPFFIPDVAGTYEYQLDVDGGGGSKTQRRLIRVVLDVNGNPLPTLDMALPAALEGLTGNEANYGVNAEGWAEIWKRAFVVLTNVVRSVYLAVSSLTTLAAINPSQLVDGHQRFVIGDMRTWMWSATLGSSAATDNLTCVRPSIGGFNLAGPGTWIPSASGPVVPTMAAFMAHLPVFNTVHVQGFYAPGDYGGGTWDYDSTDTTTADDVGLTRVFGTRRMKRRVTSGSVHAHAFGMKRNDAAFNNAVIFSSAMIATAGKFCLDLAKGFYRFWQTVLPASLSLQNTTINVTIPSNAHVRGAGRGMTIFQPGTPVLNGDPAIPAQIPMIPHTLVAMLRNHLYAGNSFAFVNGHSYYTAAGGTTSALGADAPTGVFDGTHLDGSVLWEFADSPYRGGVAMQVANNALDVLLEKFTLDGGVAWADNVAPPPYRLSGTYRLYTTPTASVPLMYAERSYNQVTYAYGWDVLHKGLTIGESANAPSGIRRLTLHDVEITRFCGESFYDSGYDLADPNETFECHNCEFSEGPTSFSSFAGGKFFHCKFRHLDQAVDVSRGIADLEFGNCDFEDCRTGISAEIGLLDQSKPGICTIHHSRFRNVYFAPISWITSFSYNHGFTGGRALRVEYNDVFDCAWNTSGGVVFFVSGPSAFNPPELDKIRCSGVRIANNKIHLGAPVAPARSGGGTAAGHLTNGFNFGGWLTDLEFEDNQWLLDDAAIAAGNTYLSAGAWQVQSNGADCFVRRNRFRGAVIGAGVVSGLTLIDATSDQFMGLWEGNILTVDGASQEWPLTTGGFNAYSNGQNLFPKFPVWYARGAGGSVLTTVAAITRPERWAYGQIIEIREDDEGSPLLIPKSSATHDLLGPRLLTPRTRLRIRRGSTSISSDVPHWYEHEYFSSDELEADFIGPLSPPNPTIESYAPGIQMWGVPTTHLAPGAPTNFDNVLNSPDEQEIHVYFTANCTFKHLSGAGAVRLNMAGGVDWTPSGSGEIHFAVDVDNGIATERLRLVGTNTSAPLNVTNLVASGNITAAAGNVSANRVVTTTTFDDAGGGFSAGASGGVSFGTSATPAAAKGIRGQSAAVASGATGGGAYVEGGFGDGAGPSGPAWIGLGDAALTHQKRWVEAFAASTTRRWISVGKNAIALAADAPDGDGFVLFHPTITAPTVAPAVGIEVFFVNGALRFLDDGGTAGTLGYVAKQKAADQSVTSSTVLVDESALQFTIAANEKWNFEWILSTVFANAGAIQVAVVTPAGATQLVWATMIPFNSGNPGDAALANSTTVSGGGLVLVPATAVGGQVRVTAAVTNGGTAGTVKLQFAQVASNGTATTVQARSTGRGLQA